LNSIIYVTQILILTSYLGKFLLSLFHLNLAKLIFYSDLTFLTLPTCAYTVVYQLSIVTSSMAYLAFIANWFNLTMALRWKPESNTFKSKLMKYFKPLLYTFIALFLSSSVTLSVVYCEEVRPFHVSLPFNVIKLVVLVIAVI
jgi:hypothetical protein